MGSQSTSRSTTTLTLQQSITCPHPCSQPTPHQPTASHQPMPKPKCRNPTKTTYSIPSKRVLTWTSSFKTHLARYRHQLSKPYLKIVEWVEAVPTFRISSSILICQKAYQQPTCIMVALAWIVHLSNPCLLRTKSQTYSSFSRRPTHYRSRSSRHLNIQWLLKHRKRLRNSKDLQWWIISSTCCTWSSRRSNNRTRATNRRRNPSEPKPSWDYIIN